MDQQASSESIDRNIAPPVQDVTVSLVGLRPELSLLAEDRPLRPLYEVVTFKRNMGMELKFDGTRSRASSTRRWRPGPPRSSRSDRT